MRYQIFTGCVAISLLAAFLLPIVIKLKDEISLGVVILIGLGLMARDFWDSLKDRDR